ncbi:LOW QUALITY PROTEIN: sushi repeat-containing protein SRPX2-like [Oculina patagonica]
MLSCNVGFNAYGSTSRKCQENGTWSGQDFQCQDILPPTFGATCPASLLIVYAERGLFSALVNWTEPVATDNSGFQPVVTSNYQPLQRLSQGTHVITYTAVDQSGNKATCSFAIEVIVINCTSLTVDPSGPLRISISGNHYGAKCNFSCTIGHRLNGSSSVTCVAPGNKPPGHWDNPMPSCQGK